MKIVSMVLTRPHRGLSEWMGISKTYFYFLRIFIPMHILDMFREEANRLLGETGVEGNVSDAKEEFGDFTYPCFSLAKKMRMNPAEIARNIVEKMPGSEFFYEIKNAGPYVNFIISPQYLSKIVLEYTLSGKIFQFEKKEKVVLEHTSANPTGPLHVGRARNPVIGDSMARIMRRYGHDVTVHYFVNDAGMQVATLLWGIKNLSEGKHDGKCDHALVKYYQEASKLAEHDENVATEIRELMKMYEEGDETLRKFARERVGCVLDGIKESLERIGVHIDEFVWESDLIPLARKIADRFGDMIEEEDGAYYIDLKKIGVEGKDKIYLYRRDGTTLYFLRDVAYHIRKSEESKYLVDVLGEDHKLHFHILQKILEILDEELKVRGLFYSFVRLPEGKMSTRRGRVVYLDDLIEEGIEKAMEVVKNRGYSDEEGREISEKVAISAIRFSILNIQEEKTVIFRWRDALNFEGESGPFIMYAYARAGSILRKAEWNGEYYPEYVEHPQEIKLIKLMAKYQDVIQNSVKNLSPYIVARYTYSLALQFNQFYRDCPVIKSEGKMRENRLAIVESFRRIMADCMNLLGLKTAEKM